MRVRYTNEALRDLDEILSYIAAQYPAVFISFERRLRSVVRRIGAWPDSAQELAERPGVRVVPLIRYPYKIFYQVAGDAVETLHIHHAARRAPWGSDRDDRSSS
jgi:plasmid stabilization system protein ParE